MNNNREKRSIYGDCLNSDLRHFSMIVLITLVLLAGFAYSKPVESTGIETDASKETDFLQAWNSFYNNLNNLHRAHRCIHQAYTACYNNNVYWFNSCNKRETIETRCGRDRTIFGEKFCYNGNVYQNQTEIDVSCMQSECVSVTGGGQVLVKDCQNAGCTNGKCNLVPKLIRIHR